MGLKLALTGFMGVGKSSVARHLARILRCERIDLDAVIEKTHGSTIAEIIDRDGLARYREIESAALRKVIDKRPTTQVLSLGGGTWTESENRDVIRASGFVTVWLESGFEHCWRNIRASRKERPLSRDKTAARKLFDERQSLYCLADWHIIIKPGTNSYDVAMQIAEQLSLD